jgi:hypothetical protein
MIGYKFRVIPFYIQCNPFYWVVGCFFRLKQYFPNQFHISLHRNLLFESPAIILPLASQGHKSDLSVSQDSRRAPEKSRVLPEAMSIIGGYRHVERRKRYNP